MKRLWLAILLLCCVSAGYADVSNLPGNGTPLGTVNVADISLQYLGQLFGSVGGLLHAPGHVQLLQELFGIFNSAIVALAIAWTSYTVVTLLFNSAMEGGFITSQRKHAVFIFARLALGFSLLLPLNSGYSALQIVGMRALIEGVNLANKVWDETVYFITKKGIIHNFSDKTESTEQNLIDSKGWTSSNNAKSAVTIQGHSYSKTATGPQAIMYDAICTAYFAKKYPSTMASQGPTYSRPDPNGSSQYINFPSNSEAKGCGRYQLTSVDSNAVNSTQASIEQNMVYDMYAVAQNFVDATFASLPQSTAGDLSSSDMQQAAENTVAALTSYVSGTQLNQLNNGDQKNGNNTADTSWETQAAQQGWLGAGRFYWLISQANWNNVQDNAANSSTADKQAAIPWPIIGKATGPQKVDLPTNGDWINQNGTGITALNKNFNAVQDDARPNDPKYTGLIVNAQSQIDLQNSTLASPGGTTSYNNDGLCLASKDLPGGVSIQHDWGDFWKKGGDPIPVGNPDGGKTTGDYYLVNGTSDSGLLRAAKNGSLGVCEQKDAKGNTYDVPVLASFDSSYDYTQCTPGEPPSCYTVTTSDQAAGQVGKTYPGVRLCPSSALTATVPSTDITSNIGYCNQNVSKYGDVKNLGVATLDHANYSSSTLSDDMNMTSALPDALSEVTYAFNKLETKGSEGLTDPIYFMTQLGASLLGAAGTLWDEGAQSIHDMALYEGIVTSVAPGAQVFSGMISWWEPLFIAVGGALFTAGFMLCFYAPLYPFVLYLLGAINWLMVCVEFMIALPLVALGVTHPEGHDFLGKAEVALMLTLSACLRPVLMVFGFIGGMIMSYIGFSAVNYMFSSVLVSVFGNMPMVGAQRDLNTVQGLYSKTPAVINSVFGVVTNSWNGSTDQATSKDLFTGSETTDVLLIPLLMVFYGYIAVEVVHFCFSMIHQLPEQVLRWIGGPVGQDRTQAIADKMQHGMQGAAKQAGEMQGKATAGQAKAQGQMVGSIAGAGIQVGGDLLKMAG